MTLSRMLQSYKKTLCCMRMTMLTNQLQSSVCTAHYCSQLVVPSRLLFTGRFEVVSLGCRCRKAVKSAETGFQAAGRQGWLCCVVQPSWHACGSLEETCESVGSSLIYVCGHLQCLLVAPGTG